MEQVCASVNTNFEASAQVVLKGVRFLILGICSPLVGIFLLIYVSKSGSSAFSLVFWIGIQCLWVIFGVYGSYLVGYALNWPGFAVVAVIVGSIIPYLNIIVWVCLVVVGIKWIRKNGFAFSLSGSVRKRI